MQWFGRTAAGFRTVSNSFLSLSSSLVRGGGGSAELVDAMLASSRDFSVVLVSSFAVVVAVLLRASLLATVNNTYTAVRRTVFHYRPTDTRHYEMIGFLTKQLRKWLGITKPKPVNYYEKQQFIVSS